MRYDSRFFFFLICILIFPSVIKNFIVHLRQGLAIAFFIAGWFSHSRVKKFALIGFSPFIHSSFFIVIPIICLSRFFIALKFDKNIRSICFIAVGIASGFGLWFVAALLGVRQARESALTAADVSGLGFLIWLFIFSLFYMQGKDFLKKYTFEIGMVVFYLGTYWITKFTARIFEDAMIPVLLAGLHLTAWRKYAFFATILFMITYIYFHRYGQPLLGWGSG